MHTTSENKLNQYIKDIEQIRHTLKTEDSLLIEKPWALTSWGIWVLIGTLVSWILWKRGAAPRLLYFAVWIPVMAVAGFFETIAWISQSRQESIPLLTRRLLFTLLALSSVIITFLFFCWYVIPVPCPLSGLIVAASGSILLLYCHVTFRDSYPEGFFLFGLGAALFVLNIRQPAAVAIGGLSIGATFLEAGIRYELIRKGAENRNE